MEVDCKCLVNFLFIGWKWIASVLRCSLHRMEVGCKRLENFIFIGWKWVANVLRISLHRPSIDEGKQLRNYLCITLRQWKSSSDLSEGAVLGCASSGKEAIWGREKYTFFCSFFVTVYLYHEQPKRHVAICGGYRRYIRLHYYYYYYLHDEGAMGEACPNQFSGLLDAVLIAEQKMQTKNQC